MSPSSKSTFLGNKTSSYPQKTTSSTMKILNYIRKAD
jgi:hypothetical protein